MESAGEMPGNGAAPEPEAESHPAREMSLHLLRMLETRMDAAGLVAQAETQRLMFRLQLRLLAAGAIFIAIWCAIVLLAIALPDNLRIPVLSAVLAGFVIAGVWCHVTANKQTSTRDAGSLSWFLEGLKQDLEVLSRALTRQHAAPGPQSETTESVQ